MPDLHGWISQQIGEREALARQASRNGADWTVDLPMRVIRAGDDFAVAETSGTWAWHIAANDPEVALRRCAADRKILEIHSYAGGSYEPYACAGCGHDDMGAHVEHANDCETLQALAEGYGITDDELAALERPEQERQASPGGKSALQVIDEFLWGMAEARQAANPVERALDILSPHLRDVPLYRPTA